MSERATDGRPTAGVPWPEAWPVRFRVKGGRVTHAGRRGTAYSEDDIMAACRRAMLWEYEIDEPDRVLKPSRVVTCRACKRRMARPLTISEALALRRGVVL